MLQAILSSVLAQAAKTAKHIVLLATLLRGSQRRTLLPGDANADHTSSQTAVMWSNSNPKNLN